MKPHVKSLRHNGDFRIAFFYDDGLVAELNFSEYLRKTQGPMVEPLQDDRFFSQAYIDHGVLTWPNGYDVCPDVLRFWCEQGRVCSREETDARFEHVLSHPESTEK
jgi:hypothetical protein